MKAEEFQQLKPGDRITVDGKPAIVIKYSSTTTALDYAWEGTSTQKYLDARYAFTSEPGERPEQEVSFVNAGDPIKSPRRAPQRRSSTSYYD